MFDDKKIMKLGLIKKTSNAIKDYVEERKKIFDGTIKSVQGRIRKGSPTLGEFSIPPSFSTEFGETSKKARISAVRKALRNFDVYKNFEDKKIL